MSTPLPVVNCRHLHGRRCAIGVHVDPSPGTCARMCKRREPLIPGPAMLPRPNVPGQATPWHPPAPATPDLWGELHRHRLGESTPAWLAAFGRRVPCGSCKHHWRKLLAATPPDYTNDAAWFAWGVARHNDVSRSIGKPEMSVEAARLRWRVFDRAVVINLDRRPERYQRFAAQLDARWPFGPVARLSAVDGWATDDSRAWGDGMRGAWGCSMSHRAALRGAIEAKATSVLVLEDDATFAPTFAADVAKFLAAVERHDPAWEMLMLGGQPLVNCNPIPLGNGVARSVGTNRFHAYGVRGPLIADLLARLERSGGHCDIEPWDLLKDRRVYEPHPAYLAGQAAGWSDIASRDECVREWRK